MKIEDDVDEDEQPSDLSQDSSFPMLAFPQKKTALFLGTSIFDRETLDVVGNKSDFSPMQENPAAENTAKCVFVTFLGLKRTLSKFTILLFLA